MTSKTSKKKCPPCDPDMLNPLHDQLLAQILQPGLLSRLLDEVCGIHPALSEWTIKIDGVLDMFDLQVRAQRTIQCDSCQYLRTHNVSRSKYCIDHAQTLEILTKWEQFDQDVIAYAEKAPAPSIDTSANPASTLLLDASANPVRRLFVDDQSLPHTVFLDDFLGDYLLWEPRKPRPKQTRSEIQAEIKTCSRCKLHQSQQCADHSATLVARMRLKHDLLFDVRAVLPSVSSIIQPIRVLRNHKSTTAYDKIRRATILVVAPAPITYRDLFILADVAVIEYTPSKVWTLYVPGQAAGREITLAGVEVESGPG